MPRLIDKIGQMLMFGWSGDSASSSLEVEDEALFLLRDLRVGSIVLMGENVKDSDQLKALTSQLQEYAVSLDLHKLLISTDQEGGRVCRLKHPPFRQTKEAWDLGESGNPKLAYDECKAIGDELREHGINWALAPILDVNNNPQNPVIGRRSYSTEPNIVAAYGEEGVKGFQQGAGILACGKHFPGHGDTNTDSHLDLPVINQSINNLRSFEFVPFRAAINAGIASIMTAHILVPAVDPEYPATLSRIFLTEILREELKFDGLIVTDCFLMHALSKRWPAGEAATLAVKAGADVVLCVADVQKQLEIRDALLDSVAKGEISEARIDESVERILAAKSCLT